MDWQFWRGWIRVLTIKIAVDGAAFEFAGDAPFSEVRPLIEQWFAVVVAGGSATQDKIDQIAARLKGSKDTLQTAVDSAQQ